MWYKFSRQGQDFLIENSNDGKSYNQMRVFHMHKQIDVAKVGIYACSPKQSSIEAIFSEFVLTESQWGKEKQAEKEEEQIEVKESKAQEEQQEVTHEKSNKEKKETPYFVQQEMKGTQYNLRTINIEQDLPRVKQLFGEGMHFYCDPYEEGSDRKNMWLDYIKNALNTDLSDINKVYFKPGGHFWVIEDQKLGNKIVGIVGVEKKSDQVCELRRMSVAKEARRRGLGTKLCRVVEEFAARNGFKEVMLSTLQVMALAQGLYKSNGFELYQSEKLMGLENDFVTYYRKMITNRNGRWRWEPLKKLN